MKYYGVITNRDYIKIEKEKVPFWNFLDSQPDGFLCSLPYARKVLPDAKMIWDCGAWSYRKRNVPTINGKKVTASWASSRYNALANDNDIVIAPDHMLIKEVDLDYRRHFNRSMAKRFLSCIDSRLDPMVVVHGLTVKERIDTLEEYKRLGYKKFALGGIAGLARSKTKIRNIVTSIREAFPNIYLHILGITAPSYLDLWRRLNINSFDGSSHFFKAFTAGTFFKEENGKLIKYKASRPDENVTAPSCDCKACTSMRNLGEDTRRYGNSRRNIGRAAHNMNQYLRLLCQYA